MAPRSATAMTAMALGMPLAMSVVPSTGSTATSHSGPLPSPTCSPLKSIGAWSFSPSPMTTTPFMLTVPMRARIASTAAPSPPFLSPRPTHRPAAIAPASVTRTSSRARLRSGAGRSERKLPPLWVAEPSGRGRDTRTSCGRRKDPFLPTLRKLRVGPEKGPWAAGWGDESCHPRGVSSAGPTSQPPAQTPSPAIERANRLSAANMLRSLGPLVLICLALVGWMSFKQSDVDPVREVDPSSTVQLAAARAGYPDRKSTRLNSSHANISYAVFCLKKTRKKEPCIHIIVVLNVKVTLEFSSRIENKSQTLCCDPLQDATDIRSLT